jgi:hypothetical protein
MASEGKDCSDRWVCRTYHSLVRAVEPWLRVLFCGTAGRTSISLAMPTRIVASIIQLRTCIHHMRNWQVLSFAFGFVCVCAGMTCGPATYVCVLQCTCFKFLIIILVITKWMDTDTFVHFVQVAFNYKTILYNIIQREKKLQWM